MKNNVLVFIIATLLLLAGGGYTGYKVCEKTLEYKYSQISKVKLLDGKERITDWKEWLSFLGFSNHKVNESKTVSRTANEYYGQAVFFGLILAIALLVYVLLTMLLFRGKTAFYKYLALAMVAVASLCLYVGITAPMMETGAFFESLKIDLPEFKVPFTDYTVGLPDKEFEDRLFFFYQNKSILDVVVMLFASGNLIVGTAILLFSLVNPILKLVFSLIILLRKTPPKNKFTLWYINNLGKWSMADVMVVSVLLSFLTFTNSDFGIATESYLLIGTYFFLSFVVVSILSGMVLKQALKKQKDVVILP